MRSAIFALDFNFLQVTAAATSTCSACTYTPSMQMLCAWIIFQKFCSGGSKLFLNGNTEYRFVAENEWFSSEPCWAVLRIVGDLVRPKACIVLLHGTTISSVKSSKVFIFCSDRTLQTGVVYVCREVGIRQWYYRARFYFQNVR